MAEVTAPLALDETLQQVVSKLGNISSVAGASAYTQAVAGGYTGTQAEFEAQIAKQPIVVNPNLLDNWYFVGGGSQQGGGQFPINQKGQTSYSGNNVYAIDRWRSAYSGTTMSIVGGGLKVETSSAVTGATRFADINLENPKRFEGKTITLSAMVSEVTGTPLVMTLRFNRNGSIYNPYLQCNGAGVFSVTVPGSDIYQITELRVTVASSGAANASSITIAAVKLELGDTQTLAHNEGTDANPVWVLNEIPNYTEELWRCQRYYQLFASSSYCPTYGEDYRPPMRLHSPTKGTISIGGTTYYYADANL